MLEDFSPGRPDSEELSPEINAYLVHATGELLRAGAIEGLKHHLEATYQFIEEMGSELTPQEAAWHKALAERFFKAELPLCVYKDVEADGEASYGLAKVDARGHAFDGTNNHLFTLNPDGSQNLHASPDEIKINQDLIDTVRALAQQQEDMGWQPVFDPMDIPAPTA